jgi:hypothetical protein
MLTQEQLQAIKAPFPPQAVSADTSRGFELTSIKCRGEPQTVRS